MEKRRLGGVNREEVGGHGQVGAVRAEVSRVVVEQVIILEAGRSAGVIDGAAGGDSRVADQQGTVDDRGRCVGIVINSAAPVAGVVGEEGVVAYRQRL